ncbi:MAG: hypothetical protein ACFCU3_01015 [Verrucomicrobiales bacterium]
MKVSLKTLINRNDGNILVMAMFFAAILASWAAASFQFTSQNTNFTLRSTHRLQAQALADGVLEMTFAYWKRSLGKKLSVRQDPSTEGEMIFFAEFDPADYPVIAEDFEGFTVERIEIKALSRDGQPLPSDMPPEGVVQLDRERGWSELPIQKYTYLVTVTVSTPSVRGGDTAVSVSRTFNVSYNNILAYAAFYEHILEIHNGPDMDIVGQVHANSRIYYGPGGGGTLTFWDRVSAVGGSMEHSGGYTTLPDGQESDAGIFRLFYENSQRGKSGMVPGDKVRFRGFAAELGANWKQSGVGRHEVLGLNPRDYLDQYPNNPNVTGEAREIIEPVVPGYEEPDGIAERRLSNFADLKIFIDSTKPLGSEDRVKVQIHTGDDGKDPNVTTLNSRTPDGYITHPVELAVYQSLGLADQDGKLITTGHSGGSFMRDNREASEMFLTDLDIGFLSQEINNHRPKFAGKDFNGGIYIQDLSAANSATSTFKWDTIEGEPGFRPVSAKKGIRLVNGAHLRGRYDTQGNFHGITVASESPMYVHGDFNTGTDPRANNTSNPAPTAAEAYTREDIYEEWTSGTNPDGTPYDRIPAMIAADAITVLSNNFTDEGSYKNVGHSDRRASHTTVNAAFVTGNVQTVNGYSGGLENFPRFLENWSGRNLNYYGSMIQLFESKHAKGRWGQNNVYNPPNRRWYHERAFLDPSFVVPGVIKPVEYSRGAWLVLDDDY